MERLQRIVQLLARPIEFASRNACAHLPTIKNLGPYVSRRVIQTLAEDVYAPAVESNLLALRQLSLILMIASIDENRSGGLQGHEPSSHGSARWVR